jgi:hypothetical protein
VQSNTSQTKKRKGSNMFHGTESDRKKFSYHESARIIRTVLDRICELTYTGNAPTHDECETLCDMLIELHQLSYGITLHTLRSDDPDAGGGYEDDELYSDGRPVVSRTWLPSHPIDDAIPAEAYRGDIGEEIPPGGMIYVWRPGDSDQAVLTGDEADEVRQNAAGENAWKACAGLRASGLIDWVRGDDGHIVKRSVGSGRAFTVSAITAAGKLACEYLEGIPSDSTEARGGLADQ